MGRLVRFEVPSDTSLFTPLQLQPRSLMQLTMTGWARWVRTHLASFPKLIHEHRFGVVVTGIRIEYPTRFLFEHDSDLQIDVGVRVVKQGGLLELKLWFKEKHEQEVARVKLLLRPLKLAGDLSMSATPTSVEGTLLSMFKADEIDSAAPERVVPGLVASVRARGPALQQGALSFRLWRHLCEVADQWSYIESVGFCGAGRESLALSGGAASEQLRATLSMPLRQIDIELSRPGFVFDQVDVQTEFWDQGGGPVFVHRLLSPKGDVLGTAVETF